MTLSLPPPVHIPLYHQDHWSKTLKAMKQKLNHNHVLGSYAVSIISFILKTHEKHNFAFNFSYKMYSECV